MAVLKLKATGRKVTGLEFGTSFAAQIERRVAAHAKKHHDEPNLMEIDLNGKELGDSGLGEVLKAVMATLVDDSSFRLEEFHLGKNGLTTAILPALSQVIKKSSFDLRALDISGNNIFVLTDDHARDWEQFLDSFRTCRVMRRLDLSGNDFCKSITMEILCRVYCSHRPIDPNELEGCAPIDDDMASSRELRGRKLLDKTNASALQPSKDPFIDQYASEGSMSDAVVLKRREGLRSIPYIVLRNVGMTDSGVLWLSKVLEQHYWPQYLMTTLKEGSHAAKIKNEDDSTSVFGIIYVDNPNITVTGLEALRLAEQSRVGLAGISEMSGRDRDDFEDPVDFSTQSRKSQMDHLRKKLQRTTLEAVGINGVQLWTAAMELMNTTRAIVPSHTFPPRHPDVPIIAPIPIPAPDERLVEASIEAPQSFKELSASDAFESDFPTLQAFPHKTLRIITTSDGASTIVDPPTPPKPSRGKGLAPRSSPVKIQQSILASRPPMNSPTDPEISLISLGLKNLRKNGWDKKKTYTPPIDQMVRKSEEWPMGMHEHLWIRVLREIAGKIGMMSGRQVDAVIRYASDRDSLRVERAAMGRARSVQIWAALERMGSLEYDMEM